MTCYCLHFNRISLWNWDYVLLTLIWIKNCLTGVLQDNNTRRHVPSIRFHSLLVAAHPWCLCPSTPSTPVKAPTSALGLKDWRPHLLAAIRRPLQSSTVTAPLPEWLVYYFNSYYMYHDLQSYLHGVLTDKPIEGFWSCKPTPTSSTERLSGCRISSNFGSASSKGPNHSRGVAPWYNLYVSEDNMRGNPVCQCHVWSSGSSFSSPFWD